MNCELVLHYLLTLNSSLHRYILYVYIFFLEEMSMMIDEVDVTEMP